MLNRRTLRVKAMQALFALHVGAEANKEVALDRVRKSFERDLNSMEAQEPEVLKAQQKEALSIFKRYLTNHHPHHREIDAASSDKINQVLAAIAGDYQLQVQKDRDFLRKQMLKEADDILDEYALMLLLLVRFVEVAEKDKKRDHSGFVKNLLIQGIRFNKSLEQISLRHNLSWNGEDEVRQWFKELVRSDEEYVQYNASGGQSFEKDRKIASYILKKLFKSDQVDAFFENRDIHWSENKPIVKSLSQKTLKHIDENSPEDFQLQVLSYNWEEDKTFFVRIFDDTLRVQRDYESLIARKSKNWDIDRLAVTDKIILEMAISEMINFPSIPVKVTINEYIEISKRYSTPKSKQFINGILDVIAKELSDRGLVKKSGRGLIDNK